MSGEAILRRTGWARLGPAGNGCDKGDLTSLADVAYASNLPQVHAEAISKRYANGKVALREISIDIERGSFIALVGPSGAGKSTFLRTINRLVEPTCGRILIEGKDITKLPRRTLRSRIGFVFQHFNLVPRLNALRNVLIGRLGYHSGIGALWPRFSIDEKALALEALERVGIGELALKPCAELSGGQQQRVAIARALAQRPQILLADEPVSSLDPANAVRVIELLRDINRADSVTVLISLHQLDLALKYSDRIIGFRDASLVYDSDRDGRGFGKDEYQAVYGGNHETQ